MSDKHEKYLVDVLGGRANRGSGNQWSNPMDGRHDRRRQSVAFAWDAKSTYYRSISVSRDMWEKAEEQAGAERPMIPLRFYDTDRLDVGLDLVVISLDDLAELLERSAMLDEIEG